MIELLKGVIFRLQPLNAIIYGIGLYYLLKWLIQFWLWFGRKCIDLVFDIGDEIWSD